MPTDDAKLPKRDPSLVLKLTLRAVSGETAESAERIMAKVFEAVEDEDRKGYHLYAYHANFPLLQKLLRRQHVCEQRQAT